jgi:hypothetical protein
MLIDRIKKSELEIVSKYIDKNNPKIEFNYLFVDQDNLVATNTRAIGIIQHRSNIEGKDKFFIHGDVVALALKQTKAVEFELQEQKIICFDKAGHEIITIQKSEKPDRFDDYNFTNYKRIIPETFKKTMPFVEHAQIQGIFAVEKIQVNTNYLPKKFDEGNIGINNYNIPVKISNFEDTIKIIIMPIVDKFHEM